MKAKSFIFKAILLFVLSLIGCDSTHDVRTYTEITKDAQPDKFVDPHAGMDMRLTPGMQADNPEVQQMLDQSVAAVDLKWTVPSGWNESPGSGMRLASFTSKEDDPIACSVISLGGVSGGVEANVQRWARQIQVPIQGEALRTFLSKQKSITSDGGVTSKVYDFRELQTDQSKTAPSMIAAIVNLHDKTVFFKMTGSLDAISRNAGAFDLLLKSIVIP